MLHGCSVVELRQYTLNDGPVHAWFIYLKTSSLILSKLSESTLSVHFMTSKTPIVSSGCAAFST